MELSQLWPSRQRQFMAEIARYGKYIFNQHIMLVLMFSIGGGGFYYQQWLKTIDATFPTALVLTVLFTLALWPSKTRTLLKQADMMYLLPLERQLADYLAKAKRFSLTMQLVPVVVIGFIGAPLYMKTIGQSLNFYWGALALLFMMKWWNVQFSYLRYETNMAFTKWDVLIRSAVNALVAYSLFSHMFYGVVALVLASFTSLFVLQQRVKGKPLQWELAIRDEEQAMMRFYRFANLFTDVPKLRQEVKRRRYLDVLLKGLAHEQQRVYLHLYARTLLRTGDYFGLVVRLTLLAMALGYFMPTTIALPIITVAALYLSGFQLIPLVQHFDQLIWVSLYPVDDEQRRASFITLLRTTLIVKTCAIALVFLLFNWYGSVLSIVVGLLFSVLFANGYARNKVEKLAKQYE